MIYEYKNNDMIWITFYIQIYFVGVNKDHNKHDLDSLYNCKFPYLIWIKIFSFMKDQILKQILNIYLKYKNDTTFFRF